VLNSYSMLVSLSLLTLVCISAQDVGAQDNPAVLVEGFEDLSKVTVARGGSLTPVAKGPAITQGKQAATISDQSKLFFMIDEPALTSNAWLKIDTFTAGQEPLKLSIIWVANRKIVKIKGIVQSGKDTLALPLCIVKARMKGDWGKEKVTLTIANTGPGALSIDNIRLTPSMGVPRESVVLDFGPVGQETWPGFVVAGSDTKAVKFSGKSAIISNAKSYPDPLVGDWIGPAPGGKVSESFDIVYRGRRNASIWFWVTHYGSDNATQAGEYGLSVGGKTLLHRRMTPAQALGPEALLEGYSKGRLRGEWTADWFAASYSKHFFKLVEGKLLPGVNRISVFNCQLAVMAFAPSASSGAMKKYVAVLGKDLVRYRRQFVMGRQVGKTCQLKPTEAEKRNGMMVMIAPLNKAKLLSWMPKVTDRSEVLAGLITNGDTLQFSLGIVPLKKSNSIRGTISPLRSKSGKILPVESRESGVTILATVPKVTDGEVFMVPWLLGQKSSPVAARQVVTSLVSIKVSDHAVSGVYAGSIKFSSSPGGVSIPLELEVISLGPDRSKPASVIMATASSSYSYSGLEFLLGPRRMDAATNEARKTLLSGVINSMVLPGCYMTSSGKIDSTSLQKSIQLTPVKRITGPTIVDMTSIIKQLESKSAPVGSQKFAAVTSEALKISTGIASRAGLRDIYYYTGLATSAAGLKTLNASASVLSKAKGKSVVWIQAKVLTSMKPADRAVALKPFQAIFLSPGTENVSEIIKEFRKTNPDRKVFLVCWKDLRFKTGFLAAGVGSDGCYILHPLTSISPHRGFDFGFTGLVTPSLAGKFTKTFEMLSLCRGESDYRLIQRARDVYNRGLKKNLNVEELEIELDSLNYLIENGLNTPQNPNSTIDSPELDSIRIKLIRKAGEVAAELNKKP